MVRPLCVCEALSDKVKRCFAEDRPVLERLPDETIFAVFETVNHREMFLGLVTAEQVVTHPSRILADLLVRPAPPALKPDTLVETALCRLESERIGALAVVDEDGRFIGAVTLVSLLKALVQKEARLRQQGWTSLERCRQECERLKATLGEMQSWYETGMRLLEAALTQADDALFQTALELLCALLQARYGALVEADEQGQTTRFWFYGMEAEAAAKIGRLPEGSGLLGPNVLGKQGTLRLENLTEHPQHSGFPAGHPPMRQLVAAQIAYQGSVLGRVYLCDRCDGEPFSAEDELKLKQVADLFALSLFERWQKQALDSKLRLLARLFEQANEGMLITDADERILWVNPSLTTITGYREEELIGKTPRLFQSEHQDKKFYQAMWQSLKETGQWQGEIWNRRKNGEVYPEWLKITALIDDKGQVSHYVAVVSDLSSVPSLEHKGLAKLAHFDHLTGLPNRVAFRAELSQAMRRARFNSKFTALLMLDLDRFKAINDGLGHRFGDTLLQQVARRLQNRLRKQEAPRIGDVVARLAGDEFGIILNDLDAPEAAENVAEKVLECFAEPFQLGEWERKLMASCGIAVYPGDGESIDELIHHADLALYRAKRLGFNRYCRYHFSLDAQLKHRLKLENALASALERGEFGLHYQPQVEIASGQIVGVEALLRWQPPELGQVSPAEFIPLLEETGWIEAVGEWVLGQVRADYPKLQAKFGSGLKVAVNIAARQLNDRLLASIQQPLAQGSSLSWLVLELTESAAMANPAAIVEILAQLNSLGIEVALDDFGTGYSSLSYLTRLPVQGLKIDRTFVCDMFEDPNNLVVIESIIALSQALKLKVIAEGVETTAQLAKLKALGCELAQGYLFGRPAPLAAL